MTICPSPIRRALTIVAILAATTGVLAQTGSGDTPAPTVETLWADAVAKEAAVRKALAGPSPAVTVLKAVRTVIADYETLVRRFPASGYCDDALWHAARLSGDAFAQFHDAREQTVTTRLLQNLKSQYPSSRYNKQAPALLATLAKTEATTTDALATGKPDAPAPKTDAAPPSPAPPPSPPAPPKVEVKQTAAATATKAQSAAPPRASKIATIKDIRRTTSGDTVRVVIELDGEVAFHDERLDNPARVFVDLRSTQPSAQLKDQTLRFDGDDRIVRQVRIGRHPDNTTRVVLEAAGVSSYSVYPLYSPYRLIIDCLPAAASNAPAKAVEPATSKPRVPDVVAAVAVRPAATSGATERVSAPPVPVPAVAALDTTNIPAYPAPLAPKPAPSNLVALRFATSYTFSPSAVPLAVSAFAETTATPAATPPAPTAPLPSSSSASSAGTPSAVAPASRNLAGGLSLSRQLGVGVSRIVIDPGHGGHDPGAKGGGINESELTLDVALRLEQLLQKVPGVEVVLTRRTDEFVALQQRTAIANRENADLFLSIHANASSTASVQGVETYFLNFATNLSAAAVAARENAASGQAMGEVPDAIKAIALHNKLDESKDFATMVQQAMVAKLQPQNKTLRDLGVKQAPFVVLIGASMPSVLAEISFLTNAQEAKLLKGAAYRQKIAEALFDAVRKYQASLSSPSVARQSHQ